MKRKVKWEAENEFFFDTIDICERVTSCLRGGWTFPFSVSSMKRKNSHKRGGERKRQLHFSPNSSSNKGSFFHRSSGAGDSSWVMSHSRTTLTAVTDRCASAVCPCDLWIARSMHSHVSTWDDSTDCLPGHWSGERRGQLVVNRAVCLQVTWNENMQSAAKKESHWSVNAWVDPFEMEQSIYRCPVRRSSVAISIICDVYKKERREQEEEDDESELRGWSQRTVIVAV